MVSVVVLRTETLPSVLNYLGILAGVAGIITFVPSHEAVGAVFGLGTVVWFAWAGVVNAPRRLVRGG